jgi:Tol biopolymer transport system component
MSPDGNYLAYVINQDGNESLWLRHLASDSNVQIVKPALVQYNAVRFSPDGSYIYYTHTELSSGPAAQDYDLYRTPVLGGSAQLLIKDIDTNISFSPDGRRFVFERTNDPEPGRYHLLIANTDGMKETSILTGPASESVGSPSWSPDGKTIVGRTAPSGDTLTSLTSVDVATSATRKVFTSTEVIFSNVSWTPDGKALAVIFSSKASNFSRNQVGIVTYPEGKFRAITADTNNYQTLSVSSDGATIASRKSLPATRLPQSRGPRTENCSPNKMASCM